MHTNEMKTGVKISIWANKFTAALFTQSKDGKIPNAYQEINI